MNEYTRDELISLLSSSQVRVKFIKADSTTRVLLGTTNKELIDSSLGEVQKIEESKQRKHSDETCVVFDLGINEWRSFRVDSVIEVEIL